MHVHSAASDAPLSPALGSLGAPECHSPPERVYEIARARGMSLVTLTDHDSIAGALELQERGFKGVIIGQEITTRFPEDGRKLHVLVWGLSADEDEQIERLSLRDDLYALAHWIRERDLAHAVAHPLCAGDDALSEWRLERLVLLFRGFEALNGAHMTARHRATLERWLASITPARLDEMAQAHNMPPLWTDDPRNVFTAGSDDHALLNLGRTWTAVEGDGVDADEFLRLVMAGKASVGGRAGSASALAHQVTAVAVNTYVNRLHDRTGPRTRLVVSKLARFVGVHLPRPSRRELLLDALKRRIRPGARAGSPIVEALRECLTPAIEAFPDLRRRLTPTTASTGPAAGEHEEMDRFTDELCESISAILASEIALSVKRRDRLGAADGVLSLLTLVAAQAPDVSCLFQQNRERRLLDRLNQRASMTDRAMGPLERPMRLCVFTDTLGDINGVSRFIQGLVSEAERTGRNLKVIACSQDEGPASDSIVNFQPMLRTSLPRYELLDVVAPPVTAMLRRIDAMQPDVVHVSTPGPVGLVGLAAAKMVGAPILGVHHTDFPAYVGRLFGDEHLSRAASRCLRWFYKPFQTVFARSETYIESLVSLGVEEERIRTLTPGVDRDAFNPANREPQIWSRLGSFSPDSVKALYVGRLSVEKNTRFLTQIWPEVRRRCAARGVDVELAIVGDGPDRARMEREMEGVGARFTGWRHDQELAAIYASSDLLLFPSTTDTLGQVVLESQASGAPVLVSDKGGPREVVDDGRTGLVLAADDQDVWIEAAMRLVCDRQRLAQMSKEAREWSAPFSLERSFEAFWSAHEDGWRRRMTKAGVRQRTDREIVVPRLAQCVAPRAAR